ncbi:phosphoenolpyruvate synthase, partial [Candidatus Woesearchaeota archaeon]|nr:phosphoenolpyruvate synthase [Candidatus Woesearchaeota archaeon]
MDKSKEFILWFDQIGIDDVGLVGGKNASLGEMYQHLTKKGVNIPNGFTITASAYRYLLEKAGVEDDIKKVLSDLNVNDVRNLAERGRKVREIVRNCHFPSELKVAVIAAYHKLCVQYGKNTDVAVRSSATAEDLPTASFAGQQETYLNIKGEHQLIEACKNCFASLFTNRAISYRADKGFDHFKVYLSIGVQKMVRSDLASSGVMFSIDTESGFRDAVFITAAYGLGENVVQGAVNPDEFYVHKPTLKLGYNSIISKSLGEKSIKMIYHKGGIKPVINIVVEEKDRKRFSVSNKEIVQLANWAVIIEQHYKKPMDMEWAKDGLTGELFIVQARPETVQSQKDMTKVEEYVLKETGPLLCEGASVGSKIGVGKANIILNVKDIHSFRKGEVLVTDMTDPDWEPIMKIASAIVTDRGGRTCHSAIISRELGIPCVVGTNVGSR